MAKTVLQGSSEYKFNFLIIHLRHPVNSVRVGRQCVHSLQADERIQVKAKHKNQFTVTMKHPGPGYASPLEAMKGPKEKLLYVICVQPKPAEGKHDLLATIDVDPESPTYCKIIHRLYTHHLKDELHHSGWNSCSSCYKIKEGCCKIPVRDKLVLPCLGSDRVYIVDTGKDPRAPLFAKVIEPSKLHAFDCATPHTSHCLASGEIMISTLGDVNGNGKGDFILIDGETLEVKGTWTKGQTAKFGYDFWYQPYHDIMVSTEWGAPRIWKRGYLPEDALDTSVYGRSLNFFSWNRQELIKSIDLGEDGIAPLEVRFLHNPKESQGFVGTCVNAKVYRFFKTEDNSWDVEKVIDVKPKKVENWPVDYIQGMITDILLSLDDKYLYFSNWLHGDVRQYDISDPKHPKLTGQVFLGGRILSDSHVKVVEDPELSEPPKPVFVKGKRLYGGPQMLQLSLDGKRLYVTSSLYSGWDHQFYPEEIENGSFMVKLNIDVENGGMKLDENFLVDFGHGPDGPLLAHEMRYPGGDCTSDIWLAEE